MHTLIIGLDGATFSVLNQLFQAGFLPNIKEAIHKGCFGELQSTIPPVTALAWPSFFTGLNPGRHGSLGWQFPINSDFKRPWINSRQIHGLKIWDVLNHHGINVFVINMPLTYPPDPIVGGMVSGMLTPNLEAVFTFPLSLKEELLSAIPDYQIDIDIQRSQPNLSNIETIIGFLRNSRRITHARGQALQWIIQNKQPDIVFVVFELLDRLQHVLWPYIFALPNQLGETQNSSVIKNLLLDCLSSLDNEIGELMNYLSRDGNLIILSDHGFGGIKTIIHMNDLLKKFGWLTYEKSSLGLWNIARSVGSRFKNYLPGSLLRKVQNSLPIYNTFQWEKTIAYSGLPTEHGIFINLKGREPSGIVTNQNYETIRSEIIDALLSWQDPLTALKPFTSVYRREEVNKGPFYTFAPDIIFELEPGYAISDLKGRKHIDIHEDLSKASWGGHERNGILAISGENVKSNYQLENFSSKPSIMDIMPTLLYLLNLEIPEDLDGKVLLEAFSSEHTHKHPPKYHKYQDSQNEMNYHTAYSDEESVLIEDRLRKLGYI